MDVIDKMIELLRRTGMSQSELARSLGVTQQSVFKWINRIKLTDRSPKPSQILALSRVFGVSMETLVDPERELPPENQQELQAEIRMLVDRLGPEVALQRLLGLEGGAKPHGLTYEKPTVAVPKRPKKGSTKEAPIAKKKARKKA